MGIYDRDYLRQPASSSVGHLHVWSITTWLIVINVVVYVIDNTVRQIIIVDGHRVAVPILSYWGSFSVGQAIYLGQVWRFFTFQFLHAGTMHLLLNMLALYFFGPMIESYLGRRQYLAFYLLSGVGGSIGYVALWIMHLLIANMWVPLVGASAGIFGILIAAATIAPDSTVLVYGMVPVRLKTLAWVLLALAIWAVFTGERNAGGEAAHLGGAAVGYLLISRPQVLRVFEFAAPRRRPPF